MSDQIYIVDPALSTDVQALVRERNRERDTAARLRAKSKLASAADRLVLQTQSLVHSARQDALTKAIREAQRAQKARR